MIMADVFAILFVHLGFMAIIICHWLVASALFPRMAEWSERRYSERPVKTLILGVVLAGPLLLAGLGLANKAALPAAKPFGTGLLLGVLFLGLLGSCGLVRRIGAGLASSGDAAAPWRGTLRGGVVLVFTLAMPLLGWFMLLPAVLLSGCGIVIAYALYGRRERAAISEAPRIEEAA